MVNQIKNWGDISPRKKTAAELLAILDAEKANFMAVAVVVGFEDREFFISAADPNRAAALEDAVTKRGGIAVGLVAVQRQGELGVAYSKVFPEYLSDHQVVEYLRNMSAVFASQFAAPPSPPPKPKDLKSLKN